MVFQSAVVNEHLPTVGLGVLLKLHSKRVTAYRQLAYLKTS